MGEETFKILIFKCLWLLTVWHRAKVGSRILEEWMRIAVLFGEKMLSSMKRRDAATNWWSHLHMLMHLWACLALQMRGRVYNVQAQAQSKQGLFVAIVVFVVPSSWPHQRSGDATGVTSCWLYIPHIGRLRFCSPRKRSMARSSLSLSLLRLLRLCLLSGAHRHRCLCHRVSQLLMLLTDLHGSSLEKGDSKYSLPFAGSLKSPSHCGKYII